MAYVSKEDKSRLAPAIKAAFKKHDLKGSISVRHLSTLVVKIKSGSIDFEADCVRDKNLWDNINVYSFKRHFTGKALAALTDIKNAMSDGNFDDSDIMTDYFNCGWYEDIRLGMDYDKPYILEK